MNIDRDVANRALMDIGEEILTGGEITQDNLKWRVIKEYYLATVTAALSTIPWTGGKRRKALVPAAGVTNYSPYQYIYQLPIDCVTPLEIQGDYFFVIENDNLLTDREGVALLYVTNGKLPAPTTGSNGTADDDYPLYEDIKMEPIFWEYVEKMLASKIATRITGRPEISQAMFAMAALLRQEAVAQIRATSGSRYNGERRWDEALNNYIRNIITRGQRESQE
jgi:hypothetical protein